MLTNKMIEEIERIQSELRKIKRKLFQDIVCKNNYRVLCKETGEKAPFYDEVVKLNDAIDYLGFVVNELEGEQIK